jgi:hypothetical protein
MEIKILFCLMDANIVVNVKMESSMGKGLSFFLMDQSIMESLLMEN